eukprot:ctg_165.g55
MALRFTPGDGKKGAGWHDVGDASWTRNLQIRRERSRTRAEGDPADAGRSGRGGKKGKRESGWGGNSRHYGACGPVKVVTQALPHLWHPPQGTCNAHQLEGASSILAVASPQEHPGVMQPLLRTGLYRPRGDGRRPFADTTRQPLRQGRAAVGARRAPRALLQEHQRLHPAAALSAGGSHHRARLGRHSALQGQHIGPLRRRTAGGGGSAGGAAAAGRAGLQTTGARPSAGVADRSVGVSRLTAPPRDGKRHAVAAHRADGRRLRTAAAVPATTARGHARQQLGERDQRQAGVLNGKGQSTAVARAA